MPYCDLIELDIGECLTVRLNKVKSKNAVSYYIIRSVRRDGKNSSETHIGIHNPMCALVF